MKELPIIYKKGKAKQLSNRVTGLLRPKPKNKRKNKKHPKNGRSRKQVKKQHTNCSRAVLVVELVLCPGHDSV
jgi:hypothetical protein